MRLLYSPSDGYAVTSWLSLQAWCWCLSVRSYPCSCLSTCVCASSLYVSVCTHVLCVYIKGGWGLPLKAWCRLKKKGSVQWSNDKKEAVEGSQGNLLLPGPCEMAWVGGGLVPSCAPAHCLHRQQWLFGWFLGLLRAQITCFIHWSNISPLDAIHLFSWKCVEEVLNTYRQKDQAQEERNRVEPESTSGLTGATRAVWPWAMAPNWCTTAQFVTFNASW